MFGYVISFVLGAVGGGVAMFIYYKKAKAALEDALAEAKEKYDELKGKL
jgi:hypothetical protein